MSKSKDKFYDLKKDLLDTYNIVLTQFSIYANCIKFDPAKKAMAERALINSIEKFIIAKYRNDIAHSHGSTFLPLVSHYGAMDNRKAQ